MKLAPFRLSSQGKLKVAVLVVALPLGFGAYWQAHLKEATPTSLNVTQSAPTPVTVAAEPARPVTPSMDIQPIVPLMDEKTRELIERSEAVARLKLKTELARLSKEHQALTASPSSVEGSQGTMVPPTTLIANAYGIDTPPKAAIERVRLAGLIAHQGEWRAFLRLDDGAARRVQVAEQWQGLTVVAIDEQGVTLRQNGRTVTLKGGR